MKHRTKNIPIGYADIDIEIIPIVNWLNAMNGVHTLFSCQGDDEGDIPHVMFVIETMNLLIDIAKTIENFHDWTYDNHGGGEEITLKVIHGHGCYSVRFEILASSLDAIKTFGEWLTSSQPDKLPDYT